ncbi:hypothetical protein ACNR9Q_07335 [Maribacter sp. X9]|uniref:hypothetical protein n=1 Tax=Maribacter sp. X9 TaxID=3402159 RepID=UPI003AF3A585
MKLPSLRTFFVALSVLFIVLSLSSCGKEYDLVSEFVVRAPIDKTPLDYLQDPSDSEVTLVTAILSEDEKKK